MNDTPDNPSDGTAAGGSAPDSLPAARPDSAAETAPATEESAKEPTAESGAGSAPDTTPGSPPSPPSGSASDPASDPASDAASDAASDPASGGRARRGDGMSRRAMIASVAATAGAAGSAGAVAAGYGWSLTRDDTVDPRAASEPFYGSHQPGIATPPQTHVLFAAFDLATVDRMKGGPLSPEGIADNFRRLMENWSRTAERLMRGAAPGAAHPDRPRIPAGTGVADGLSPARLTVTFGLGPGIFERIGQEDRRPRRLRPLPPFKTDRLQAAWCGGELLVQICAEDPQVVSHAFRTIRSRTPGLAILLWSQQGFLSVPADGSTPRNLFGHKDGTANPRPGTREFDEAVWCRAPEDPDWFTGGSYLVFRKIRMNLPRWDLASTEEQNKSIGRRRDNGAPLSGGDEFTELALTARGQDGTPAIPADAHVALIKDIPMYRRGYNYDYGFQAITTPVLEPGTPGAPGGHGGAGGGDHHEHGGEPGDHGDHGDPPGEDGGHTHGEGQEGEHDHGGGGHDLFDSGLLFCAYMRDPDAFVRAQNKLAASDRLNTFIEHTGSAMFAVPPGSRPGRPIASALFAPR